MRISPCWIKSSNGRSRYNSAASGRWEELCLKLIFGATSTHCRCRHCWKIRSSLSLCNVDKFEGCVHRIYVVCVLLYLLSSNALCVGETMSWKYVCASDSTRCRFLNCYSWNYVRTYYLHLQAHICGNNRVWPGFISVCFTTSMTRAMKTPSGHLLKRKKKKKEKSFIFLRWLAL